MAPLLHNIAEILFAPGQEWYVGYRLRFLISSF